MTKTKPNPDGPFCSVPGCVETAAGAVMAAYMAPDRLFLCSGHLRPVRRAVAAMIAQVQRPVAPDVDVVAPAAIQV